MKPVIVQVVQHLRPGGIETMALDLLQQLQAKAEVHIFSLEGDAPTTLKAWPRLYAVQHQLHFFNKKSGLQPALIGRLAHALKRVGASAVHTHHIGPLLYGGAAARLAGLNHVHTEHDAWHLNIESSRKLQNMLIRTLKPQLVADCSAVAEALQQFYPFTRPTVIMNGVDTQRFLPPSLLEKRQCRAQLGLPQEGLLLGCAARLEPVKGHALLLEALRKAHSGVSLVLAGDGSLRHQLQDETTRLGLNHRVFFLGHLDDTLPFYHAIDLFCLPSFNEGLPLSPLEAQACGVPAIVSDVGGCRSVVCPQSSQLVPSGSAGALADAISSYQVSPQHNPRDFVVSTGNLQKTAAAYFNLLAHS